MRPAGKRRILVLLHDRVRGVKKLWLVRSHYLNDDAIVAFRRDFTQTGYRFFANANGIEVYTFEVPGTKQ